jgi:hypothetical protein
LRSHGLFVGGSDGVLGLIQKLNMHDLAAKRYSRWVVGSEEKGVGHEGGW